MNAISTLKRSLVISGAALVLAVPAAQASHEPSQQDVSTLNKVPVSLVALNQVTEPPVKQVAVKAAAPSSEAGLQMQRFQHAATRGPQPAPIATTEDHVEWVNFAIGGLIVALVFSLLYLGVSRTQMPGKPRPQA